MLSSKDRAKLKGLASKMDAIAQIGLEGVTDNLLKTLDGALENRELIKVKILQNSSVDAKVAINEIAEKLNAEPVLQVGRVMVFYRISKKKNIKHIEL